MIVGTITETFPGERRVALAPTVIPSLQKLGLEIIVQAGAGVHAGFPDADFEERGARIVADRQEVIRTCDVLCQVRTLGANPEHGRGDLEAMKQGQLVVGQAEALSAAEPSEAIAARGALLFAMELMPRITRAQGMDVLSSQATVAGYKAVLVAADHLPRMFPMLMTAAGTVAPAHVFVIGAGVAGLQAISTAKRLGAVVNAYDVRPAVKEQVESLGGKFLMLELETAEAEDKGGYATAMDETFYEKQREMMTGALADNDVVITTAAVPGKKAPILITADMVRGMRPGSVIVDLAAERGGNCELTKADETVDVDGVTVLGPSNLAATVPYHASQMYARNITSFLQQIVKDGQLVLDETDEVVAGTMVTRDGQIVQRQVREILGLGTPQMAEVSEGGSASS